MSFPQLSPATQLVYGPCYPLHWAPLCAYTATPTQSSAARAADAWLFTSEDAARLEDHFCDVILTVGTTLGAHPATSALATLYFRALSRVKGFTALDPRLTAPACLVLAGKSHGNSIAYDALVSVLRHTLSPPRAPYGLSDVAAAEPAIRALLGGLLDRPLPLPHSLLAALLKISPLVPPPGSVDAATGVFDKRATGISPRVCAGEGQARWLAWAVCLDLFRSPLAASVYLHNHLHNPLSTPVSSSVPAPSSAPAPAAAAAAAAAVAAVAVHVAATAAGIDASALVRVRFSHSLTHFPHFSTPLIFLMFFFSLFSTIFTHFFRGYRLLHLLC